MLNYKILTERKIINKFFHYIKRVNPRKKYSPSSLTKEEYSKVKELLMVRMQMNNEQADFILKKRYVNSPLKESLFNLEKIVTKDYTYLTNSRQISLAKQAYKSLLSAEQAIIDDQPIDMIEIDLKECFDTLGEIIGATYSEEIIDNLFENFCVGK